MLTLINTFSTGLLAYGPRSDSNGFALTKGIINVVNVEITGKAVILWFNQFINVRLHPICNRFYKNNYQCN